MQENFAETFPNPQSIFAKEKHNTSDQDHSGKKQVEEEGHNVSYRDQNAMGETSVGVADTVSVSCSDFTPIKSEDQILQFFYDSITADVNPIENADEDVDTRGDDDENDRNNTNKPSIPRGNEIQNSCPVCKAVLESKMKLNFHVRKYHIAEPVCYLCGKSLKSMTCLKEHIRKIHKQEFYEMSPENATCTSVSTYH